MATVKISIYPRPDGGQRPWIVQYRPEGAKGKRVRHACRTREEADAHAATVAKQHRRWGSEGTVATLAPAEVREYREAKAAAEGADLVRVAREWRERIAGTNSPSLELALAQFLDDQEGNRPAYQYALKTAVGATIEALGAERSVAEPSAAEIEGVLVAAPLAVETRANRRRMFGTFMNWCRRRGWRADDPMQLVKKIRVARPTPHFYSVDQVQRILEAVGMGAPWLIPAVALRLFAGVRSYEVKRLATDYPDDAQPERILVRAEVAKGKSGAPRPRLIEGLPNVGDWLALGDLWWPSWGDEMLRDAIGDAVSLLKNGMRHTFGTYAVAYFESHEKTAKLMGNSAEIVRKHYAGLATKAQAEAFFGLTPEGWP